jgi:hypothetical protein
VAYFGKLTALCIAASALVKWGELQVCVCLCVCVWGGGGREGEREEGGRGGGGGAGGRGGGKRERESLSGTILRDGGGPGRANFSDIREIDPHL